ncbi:MAG: hypothetical protein KAR00_01660 [Candidatus Pacebacteria bacterium]|nr:hypothetical protein [Candidatus Paceibacterota bacterium]
MTEIIPAIIPKSFDELQQKMALAAGLVSLVQIDILDGKLTPKASWPYVENTDVDFDNILKEKKGFPFWEQLNFEADLMVEEPEKIWHDWVTAGVKRIIIHCESRCVLEKLIDDIVARSVPKESPLYTELGVAINIETPLEKLELLVPKIDFVQFMGIAKIGFQGEPFDERVIEKIKEFKSKYPDIIVSVDGGVSLENAPALISAGAERLVVGSAIFGNLDISSVIEEFKNLLQ